MLTDASGLVLLFHVLTPDETPDGWWELPGGGIEPGETYLDTTVREIAHRWCCWLIGFRRRGQPRRDDVAGLCELARGCGRLAQGPGQGPPYLP